MDQQLPSELENPSFKGTAFGGYDKKEVQRFLMQVSREWGMMTQQNQQLSEQVNASRLEVTRLHDIESALLEELRTLREERQQWIERSQEESRIEVMKGRMKAEKIIQDAKERAELMIRDAQEKYQHKMDRLRHEMQTLEGNYNVVQSHSDKLIKEMMNLMDNTLDQITRLTSMRKIATLEDKLTKTHQVLNQMTVKKSLEEPQRRSLDDSTGRTKVNATSFKKNSPPQSAGRTSNGSQAPGNSSTSFFDNI